MVQLNYLNRVFSKMAMVAIIAMLFAGIAYAGQNTLSIEQAIEQREDCKEKKQQCKLQKKENKRLGKEKKQQCKEQCKAKKQLQKNK